MIRNALQFVLAAQLAAAPACVTTSGDRILAAELAAELSEFSALPPETALGYAPAFGAKRILGTEQLVRFAKQHGVELTAGKAICVERATRILIPEELLAAMRATFDAQNVRLSIVDFIRTPVPLGETVFPRQGLPASAPGGDGPVLWRGYVQYAPGRKFPIWARIKVSAQLSRIVAVVDLEPGRPADERQVRVEEMEGYPRNAPGPRVEDVLHKAPRRLIKAGDEVIPSLFVEVRSVARGEKVQVEVQSGSARLTMEGRAESAGDVGGTISVRNLQNGRLFSARVSGKGRAVVNTP
jgi:flagella basal body P-ring formation protein FlgA